MPYILIVLLTYLQAPMQGTVCLTVRGYKDE